MYEYYSGSPDTLKHIYPATSRSVSRTGSSSGRTSTGPSNRNSSSSSRKQRRSPKKKKQILRHRIFAVVAALILVALIVAAIAFLLKSCNPETVIEPDPEIVAYRSDVYINGTNVSGKTMDEVREQLVSNEQYAIDNIAITLSGDGFSETITGADMGVTTNLEEVMQQAFEGSSQQVYYTSYFIDESLLADRIDAINATLASPPTDASFTIDFSSSGKPRFNYTEGHAGMGIDVSKTSQMVQEAFANGQLQTVLTPALSYIEPAVTTEDLKSHTTLIGSFSTAYDFKGTAEDTQQQREELIPNRAFNIEKAVSSINNIVIKPGRTFSFNETVGDRIEKNGWRLANGIFGGDKYTLQYGGGVCQVSTTMYNALLQCYPYCKFSRRAHSIPSTYVEKGLDATVDTKHIDFKVTNQSEYPLYVFAYVSSNRKASGRKRDINVLVYGEALPEGITYSPHTEIVSETYPGEPEITKSNKMFIGEETITAEARNSYIVDVYIDRKLNGITQESIFMYTDTYDGNPLRKKIGTKPTPTPFPGFGAYVTP